MLDIRPIPAFSDNYLWLLSRDGQAAVVDPGDAAPVRRALEIAGLQLAAILITHHHPDHVGGMAALISASGPLPVYGPRAEAGRIPGLTVLLDEDDEVEVLNRHFRVLSVPGHTSGHIAYYSKAQDGDAGLLFCGDTLFSAGCGRLFEGTPAQMYASLHKLAALPPATAVYCTHEYTQSNLAFAKAVEPGNAELRRYDEQVRRLREQGQPSLPSSLALECAVNPFLRTAAPEVRAAAVQREQRELGNEIEVFASLRRWKDGFRVPAVN